MEQRHRVVIVEDDAFMGEFLSNELAGHGFAVHTAANGVQALESVDYSQVCAVVTDIFMPDMDGLELIRTLRKRYPQIPVFALSGGADLANKDDYLRFAKLFGAEDVFAKPVDVAALAARIKQHCQTVAGVTAT